MPDDISEEVLELSYEELQTRFEYHLQEWEAQRNAAIRTFTASLLFISVTVGVISVFPDKLLLQFSSQPITDIWSIIGPIVGSLGLVVLFIPLFLSLWTLREMPQSLAREFNMSIPDVVNSEIGDVAIQTANSVVYPKQSREQWYRAVASEYANILREVKSKSTSFDPGKSIRIAHISLMFGLFLLIIGVGMTL